MSWLFAEVWLWSLGAFFLGALVSWLLFARPARRRNAALSAQLRSIVGLDRNDGARPQLDQSSWFSTASVPREVDGRSGPVSVEDTELAAPTDADDEPLTGAAPSPEARTTRIATSSVSAHTPAAAGSPSSSVPSAQPPAVSAPPTAPQPIVWPGGFDRQDAEEQPAADACEGGADDATSTEGTDSEADSDGASENPEAQSDLSGRLRSLFEPVVEADDRSSGASNGNQ